MGLKKGSLERKIHNNRSEIKDLRGKHENHKRKFCEFMIDDIKSFINTLPNENAHYSENKEYKYISSDFGSIANIYRIFIDIYIEYKNDVSYKMFKQVFKTCNLKFKKPRNDICETCDEIICEINSNKRLKNSDNLLKELENKLKIHREEANLFYELKNKL